MLETDIPESEFERFHNSFKGDNTEIFSICSKCEGKCEYAKIGSLLPGEKEYIAKKMSMETNAFKDLYLDGILFKDNYIVDVVKMISPCPFLDKQTFNCTIKNFKVILCEIYPIVWEISNNEVQFYLDKECPLSQSDQLTSYFFNSGIPLIKSMNIPLEWIKKVETYDSLDINYSSLQKERKTSKYQLWDIDTILKYGSRVP
jgi:uncharacterized protein